MSVRGRRRLILVKGVVAAIVVILGWMVFSLGRSHDTSQPAATGPLPRADRQEAGENVTREPSGPAPPVKHPSAPEKPAGAAHQRAIPSSNRDDQLRELVVGTWEDDYQGKRTMTLAQDGTGTMVVELGGLKASLFASRLRFDMVWSIEGGRLKKRTTGGEPAAQVQLILKTMGDRVDEPILELTRRRLLLLDGDGKTKYDWRRVR